jgi:GNAT superfamily N-acetyltransferase
MVVGDFHMIAGDPGVPGAVDALLAVPSGEYISVPEHWHEFVRKTLPVAEPKDRFSLFAPHEWDRSHLAGLRESLPPGYTLRRVDESSVAAFRYLNETFVDNFASLDDYLQRGIGFAVSNERGEIVAGCSTYTISSRCLEFEIETHVDYQRRGLALATGARMIEHCLEAGLEPCWDAAHDGSARLAERLGFVGRRRYTAYKLA